MYYVYLPCVICIKTIVKKIYFWRRKITMFNVSTCLYHMYLLCYQILNFAAISSTKRNCLNFYTLYTFTRCGCFQFNTIKFFKLSPIFLWRFRSGILKNIIEVMNCFSNLILSITLKFLMVLWRKTPIFDVFERRHWYNCQKLHNSFISAKTPGRDVS